MSDASTTVVRLMAVKNATWLTEKIEPATTASFIPRWLPSGRPIDRYTPRAATNTAEPIHSRHTEMSAPVVSAERANTGPIA
jgi:hypothetical protein